LAVVLGFQSLTLAQGLGPNSVHYTEARSYRLNQEVILPGTVESNLVSTVASEVEGLVIEFPVREGEKVEEGQVLARLSKEDLEIRLREAEAQLQEDEARMRLSERTLERIRELLEKGAVSQQDLDDAFFEFNAWQGRTERLRAVIDQLQADLKRTAIRAPFAGVIVREGTQLGEWVQVGGAVVELHSLEALEVAVAFPEKHFHELRRGMEAWVSFEALSETRVKGTTTVIIPRADPRSRTFPVKLRIPGLGGRIGIGMLAQVEFSFGRSQNATIIPKDAVVRDVGEQVVFVLNGDDTVRRTIVQTGFAVGAWVEVGGQQLQPGQRVITLGNERLIDGQEVVAMPAEKIYELP
jgi:RND family efflux transporter MFP subunit